MLNEIFGNEGDGIGVSYIRISIGASDLNPIVFSYDDPPTGKTDENLSLFSFGPDKKCVDTLAAANNENKPQTENNGYALVGTSMDEG